MTSVIYLLVLRLYTSHVTSSWVALRNAMNIGSDAHKLFVGISARTTGLRTLYLIVRGLCEGGDVISSDGKAVFYGVLDLLAKPVLGFWMLCTGTQRYWI